MNLMWTALLMGLMGGFHCIGMCGPIALALPNGNTTKWQYVRGRLAYNFGRMATYSIMGLVFGIFGLSLNLAGMQQGISIISGLLILLLQFAPGNLSGKISGFFKLPTLVNRIKRSFSFFLHKKGTMALFSIGLLNGILPCGFVYLALAGSLAAGSVNGAGLYMALFGLGTLPIMLTLSLSGKLLSIKFKSRIQKAVPYVATCIALLFILRGLSLGIPYVSPQIQPAHGAASEIPVCH